MHNELKSLFGERTFSQSSQVDPSTIDAPSVKQAVGALLHLKGQPEAQHEYVRSMPPELAAGLCRWLSDPSFWGQVAQVVGITVH